MSEHAWRARYEGLERRLPALVGNARAVLCGLSVCIDAYVALDEAKPLLAAAPGTPAGALARALLARAARGIGGEIRVEWPDGPAWLDANLPERRGLGGTGAQAAQTLAILGAPAVLALADRSREQLALIHPEIGLATADGVRPAGTVAGTAGPATKPPHYIFEFTAGRAAGGVVPPRSSRVIVRFAEDPLEDDPWFEAAGGDLAASAGAGILSGFNSLDAARLPATLAGVARLGRRWREGGLRWVHLELGDYPSVAMMTDVLSRLAPVATSLGLSRSELDKLLPDERPVPERASVLAERNGLERVVIHADEWALGVTQGDPGVELEALLLGSLLAATRARHGRIAVPEGCPPGARFAEPPAPPIACHGAWHVVACAAPYLPKPAATIGLGDTFVAGCLLVLGQAEATRPTISTLLEGVPR